MKSTASTDSQGMSKHVRPLDTTSAGPYRSWAALDVGGPRLIVSFGDSERMCTLSMGKDRH